MKAKVDSMARRKSAVAVSKLFSGETPNENDGVANPWDSEDRDYRDEAISDLHMWADLEALADDEEILNLGCTKVMATEARVGAKRWRGFAVAASLMLGVFATLWLTQGTEPVSDDSALRYVSRTGEVKTVTLSDGTEMSLNTGSEALFVDTAEERTVILQRGELFLNVAKDESRPFVVKVDKNAITVLGTSFYVRKYPSKIEVSVIEGLVASHPVSEPVSATSPLVSDVSEYMQGNRQVKVSAGWKADVDSSTYNLIASEAIPQDADPGWTEGVLPFKREELYKVVQELNRYSAKKILIEDKSIMDMTVSAVIKIESLNTALAGLEISLPIKVSHDVDKIVITRK